jgi:hypothetical protein
MSEENKENRINVDDLPQGEKELTAEEAKEVKGGIGAGGNFGDTPGLNGGDMVAKMSR